MKSSDSTHESKNGESTPLLQASVSLPTHYGNIPDAYIPPASSISHSTSTHTFAVTHTALRPPQISLHSGSSLINCCLCLESKDCGVLCEKGHFICRDECFAAYVLSVCEETYKLRKNKGRITCPHPRCTASSWTSAQVREGLFGHPHALDEYTDSLVRLVDDIETGDSGRMTADQTAVESRQTFEHSKTERLKEMVCDALTLKCPNPMCHLALDPNPDGCCSMKCLKCGVNFCWLCFRVTGLDSSASHQHVQQCPENPAPNNLFVSAALVEVVHKRRRLEAIRRCLLSSEGNGWQLSTNCMEAVAQADPVLKDSHISAEHIFSSTAIAPSVNVDGSDGHPIVGAAANAGALVHQDYGGACRTFCLVVVDLFLVGVGVATNIRDKAVHSYTIKTYSSSLIYLSIWYGFIIALAMASWCMRRDVGLRDRLLAIIYILAGFLGLCILMVFIILLYEGVFFTLDCFFAHFTGSSMMGSAYWNVGDGWIPVISGGAVDGAVCHWLLLGSTMLLRFVWLPPREAVMTEAEKNFCKTLVSIVVIVLCLGLYHDYGGNLTKLTN